MNSFRLLLRRTNALHTTRLMSTYPAEPPAYEELMNCKSRRWLYNNNIQMALRRLDFNVESLGKIAEKASGGSECNEIAVIGEGTFNRIFRLSFETGNPVIARIPFPNAGPRSLLTRSEVATMDFVRARLGAPVPNVLAWDASSDNEVGCEYIIMEKCAGDLLANRFAPNQPRHLIHIAQLLSGLSSIPFSQYGSIYYKEDVDPLLQARSLYAEGIPQDNCSERFRIGPSIDRRFYRAERARMDIDRGPWKDVHTYIKAAVDCETKWLRLYSNTSSAQNQQGAYHTADQHISLLDRWLTLAPAVLPSPAYCAPTLSHPDLHAANIFVNPDGPTSVTGIIDWQGATVRPLFETPIPEFIDVDTYPLVYANLPEGDLEQPFLPDNYDELSVEQQFDACTEVHQIASKHHLLRLLSDMQPALYASFRLLQMDLLRRAIYYSSFSWSDGLSLLENTLISLTAAYGDYIPVKPEYPVCPVSLSEEDAKRHESELKDINAEEWMNSRLMAVLKNKGITAHRDGSVNTEHFETARRELDEQFIDLSSRIELNEGKEHAERFKRLWPFREGKFELSTELCV